MNPLLRSYLREPMQGMEKTSGHQITQVVLVADRAPPLPAPLAKSVSSSSSDFAFAVGCVGGSSNHSRLGEERWESAPRAEVEDTVSKVECSPRPPRRKASVESSSGMKEEIPRPPKRKTSEESYTHNQPRQGNPRQLFVNNRETMPRVPQRRISVEEKV